ncbi:MAG: hypothetical protein ACRDIL_09565 [Candidatus Limnocylindrales bacterium]
MSFSRWLRSNSEHYLLIAAQERVARRYGTRPPRKPHGLVEIFWLRVFAPMYRVLPWSLRHKLMSAMPGSHRRTWTPPPEPRGSALQPDFFE